MSAKEDIINCCRTTLDYPMPALDDIAAVKYPDPLAQFVSMSAAVGSKVVELQPGEELDTLLRSLFPEAVNIASNLPETGIANRNPDTVGSAAELDGTDVGVIRGSIGVAENGCIWVPQTMKERAVCFISEQLVILLSKDSIVSNMHEAMKLIRVGEYGYGCFISGPSKTADIAQVLVMGAQAARSLTVVLLP
ncbi:MAG: LUD domain-containing protein [Bacteroidales bacterium]|nr:LUD domain-containing protein [Bacteroidales bacterium]